MVLKNKSFVSIKAMYATILDKTTVTNEERVWTCNVCETPSVGTGKDLQAV